MEKIGLKDFEVYVDAIISVSVVSGSKTMEPWQVLHTPSPTHVRERERARARVSE